MTYEEWKSGLVFDEDTLGGELRFPGTRLSVRHIGNLALNLSKWCDILEDYPYLMASDLMYARIFVLDLVNREVAEARFSSVNKSRFNRKKFVGAIAYLLLATFWGCIITGRLELSILNHEPSWLSTLFYIALFLAVDSVRKAVKELYCSVKGESK